MSNAALDKKILLPTIAIVLLTSAPLIFYTSSLQGMIQSIYDFTAKSFGWGYILLYLLGGFFVFFIAFSPYGKIKLGGHDQKPVFNNFHWGSMIIAAGHGIGMVNWSMVEPLITNNAAPLGHGANAAYSYEVATAYTFFHWGPYYWVLYLIPCIPIFYFMGVRQVKKQRVANASPLFSAGSSSTAGSASASTYSSSWASPGASDRRSPPLCSSYRDCMQTTLAFPTLRRFISACSGCLRSSRSAASASRSARACACSAT